MPIGCNHPLDCPVFTHAHSLHQMSDSECFVDCFPLMLVVAALPGLDCRLGPIAGPWIRAFNDVSYLFQASTQYGTAPHHAFTVSLPKASRITRRHILTWVRNADCIVCDTNELSGLASTSVPVLDEPLLPSLPALLFPASDDILFWASFLRMNFLCLCVCGSDPRLSNLFGGTSPFFSNTFFAPSILAVLAAPSFSNTSFAATFLSKCYMLAVVKMRIIYT